MNRKLWLWGLTLIITFLSGTSLLADGKWIVLFDGKSKDAWRGYQRKEFPDKGWAVDRGAFKTIVGGDQVDLVTKQKFRNFELELEWKVSTGGNGGIFYRAGEDDKEIWHSAPEIQVLDDDKHGDGKNPKTSAASLYALVAPVGKKLRPVGKFNHLRLVLNKNHGEHWLNGVKVFEYELDSPKLKELIAQSKFKDLPRFAMLPEGNIGIQHHGQEVWYRKIRVRELP
jgi:3-keto-disaccharide hydrolase